MKGICFKEPLFYLTIEMVKTHTRRIIPNCDFLRRSVFVESGYETHHGKELKPKYNVGEIIYLKEPYVKSPNFINADIVYKYGYPHDITDKIESNTILPANHIKWKNKLFMRESDARYFIQIKNVWAEKLQDISDEDCIKEGIGKFPEDEAEHYWVCPEEISMEWFETPQAAYAFLIDKINGKGTWERNPFVWVYDYELIENK